MALQTFRFSDVDQFRSSVRTLAVDFTPLVRKIDAEQTILALSGIEINVTRSFPRVIDASNASACTSVGFTLDDHPVPIRFNGMDEVPAAVVIGSGGASYSSVERTARRYASIVFSPAVDNRGWPAADTYFRGFRTSASAHGRLREIVNAILDLAEGAADLTHSSTATGIGESLLAAVDQAFHDVIDDRTITRADPLRSFKLFGEVRSVLSGDLGRPVYSGDLAKTLGVSVRTLQDVIYRYRGMSLHRYLKLRRLWLVRKRLRAGADSVKEVALAFGFWHLGDFSRSYRHLFGENASDTLRQGQSS